MSSRPCPRVFIFPQNEQKQLEEWTGVKCSNVIFDSNIDNWKQYESVFNERIIGKKQLVFLIESEDGDKFGYYSHDTIDQNNFKPQYYQSSDSFLVNISNRNGILNAIKCQTHNPYNKVQLFDESDKKLIQIGDILLQKKEYENESCWEELTELLSANNNTKRISSLSSRSNGFKGKQFTPKRIIVLQMK